jgi:hypothetical protein
MGQRDLGDFSVISGDTGVDSLQLVHSSDTIGIQQMLSPKPVMPSSVSISIRHCVTPFLMPVEMNSGLR